MNDSRAESPPSPTPETLPPAGRSLLLMALLSLGCAGAFGYFLWKRDPKPAWLSLGAGVLLLNLLPRQLPGLRERHKLKQARKEAERLVEVVRKSLARVSLSLTVQTALETACNAVEQAALAGRLGELDTATQQLDQLAEKHIKRRHPTLDYILQVGGAILAALLLRAFFYEAFRIPSGSMVPTLLVGDHLFVNKFVYGLRIPFTLNKIWARFPERGDIVVFNRPGDENGDDIIKRVIGLPGETVMVRDGTVSICAPDGNCSPLPTKELGSARQNDDGDTDKVATNGPFETFDQFEEQAGQHTHMMQLRQGLHPETLYDPAAEDGLRRTAWKVRPGHVFVMGDNRDNSQDSRFGPEMHGFGQVPVEHIKGRADVIWLSVGGPYGVRFDRMFSLLP